MNIPEAARNEAWAKVAQDILDQIADIFGEVTPHPFENIFWWSALYNIQRELQKKFSDTLPNGHPRQSDDSAKEPQP